MPVLSSRSAQSLAARELATHFSTQDSISKSDLVSVVRAPTVPLTTRLAARAALEAFPLFDASDSDTFEQDGRVTPAGLVNLQDNAFPRAPPLTPSAAALVGERVLQSFGALDVDSNGLLRIDELEAQGDTELNLAVKACRELFTYFDTAVTGEAQKDAFIGMNDLQAVVEAGQRDLARNDIALAARGARARVMAPHGDPGWGHIQLMLEWDEEVLGSLDSGLVGLPWRVFADVPSLGRRELKLLHQEGGVQYYAGEVDYQSGSEHRFEGKEVRFCVATPSWEVPDIAAVLPLP